MIKNDTWIAQMAQKGMISPFEPSLIREQKGDEALPLRRVLSYGLSSYGYDIRLSPTEFRIFRHIPGTIVDPKNFNPQNLEPTQLHTDASGSYFILPAHSYGLGVALERLEVPDNITVICIGKSTYARCFRADTRVALVDGTAPTLEEMAQRAECGEKFWGYSIGQHGRVIVTLLESPRYIGQDSLLKVTLDNHQSIFCTPDHLFLTRDGRMVEAHTLRTQDSLMPLYRQLARGYEMVYQPLNGHLYPTHRLSDEWNARFSQQQQEKALKFWHDPQYTEVRQRVIEDRKNCSDATRQAHREAMIQYYKDPRAKALTGELSRQVWSGDDGTRRSRQSQLMKKLADASKTRHEITSDVVRAGLDQTGSIRGAARLLNCDRSVFRRFSEVIEAFRGQSRSQSLKNHKVVSVEELPGTHDVYCLTVPEAGNFALEAGVFVHNCGIIANLTPAEAAWRGHLTLEFSNSSSADCRIYANEGVVQLLFLEGEPCAVSYEARRGKYQDQPEFVTIARI